MHGFKLAFQRKGLIWFVYAVLLAFSILAWLPFYLFFDNVLGNHVLGPDSTGVLPLQFILNTTTNHEAGWSLVVRFGLIVFFLQILAGQWVAAAIFGEVVHPRAAANWGRLLWRRGLAFCAIALVSAVVSGLVFLVIFLVYNVVSGIFLGEDPYQNQEFWSNLFQLGLFVIGLMAYSLLRDQMRLHYVAQNSGLWRGLKASLKSLMQKPVTYAGMVVGYWFLAWVMLAIPSLLRGQVPALSSGWLAFLLAQPFLWLKGAVQLGLNHAQWGILSAQMPAAQPQPEQDRTPQFYAPKPRFDPPSDPLASLANAVDQATHSEEDAEADLDKTPPTT